MTPKVIFLLSDRRYMHSHTLQCQFGLWCSQVFFPANVEMAAHPERFKRIPKPLLYARLPLQGAMVAWVWKTALR